jgi:hypothetical protein
MMVAAGTGERHTVNTSAESSRFPRRAQEIRGLRFAVAAVMAVGVTVAVTSCSSHPPNAQGHPVSPPSIPSTAASTLRPVTSPPSVAVESTCSFVVGGAAICDSKNPQVKVYVDFSDDTSGCTFVRDIDWGDGTSSENIVIQGGPAGPKFVDRHTYSAPGSYTIFLGGKVTQGNCIIRTPTFRFEFLSS